MLNEVIKCIRNYYNMKDMEITADSKLIYDLGLESYDVIELCGEIEETFSIVVNENDLAAIETVGDMSNYIESYQSKKR